MKALTLTQPWASLVALGEKRYETRSWSTEYRGPLAIHAAKGVASIGGEKAFRALCEDWDEVAGDFGPFGQALFVAGRYAVPSHLPRGQVVAIANLIDCVPMDKFMRPADGPAGWLGVEPGRFEMHFGDYSPGRFAWVLDNVQRMVFPQEAKGYQQLWDWGCALDDVLHQLDGATGRLSITDLCWLLLGRSVKWKEPDYFEMEAAVHALLEANLCGEEPGGYFFTDGRDPQTAERLIAYRTEPA